VKFRVGQRVILTKAAQAQGLQGRAKTPTGVVMATSPLPGYIKVRRDGLSGIEIWGDCHWSHLRARREGPA
jgi:hypothetical protein